MRKPTKTKEELTKTFVKVFRKNGLIGTTLSQLVYASGLQRASLYHFFPKGKKDMSEAVLRLVIKELGEKVLSTLNKKHPPKKQLQEMIKATEIFYNKGKDICLVTIFSIGESSDSIHQIKAKAINTWISQLEKTLKEMGVRQAKTEATLIVATIQGALILSHATNKPFIFKNCLNSLKNRFV